MLRADRNSARFEEAIATGLGLPGFQPANGHGVWRASHPLVALLDTASRIVPTDLVTIRAQLISDERRSSLSQLLRSASDRDVDALRVTAKHVKSQFAGQEHLLDVFCQHPAHRNGSRLRDWLETVTTSVTQDQCAAAVNDLGSWLRPLEDCPSEEC